jgi:hypothetical protein
LLGPSLTLRVSIARLQQAEAAAFVRAVEEVKTTFPAGGHRLKLAHVEAK